MGATPTMTYFATMVGTNGRTRKIAVSLPLVECIAGEAHYQPPAPRNYELPQERRGRIFTKALVRRALGRDRERIAALRDELAFQATMRRILGEPEPQA
jgi:hypothetical protein